jgi:hypothetical protein
MNMNLGDRLKAAAAVEQEAARRAELAKQAEVDEVTLKRVLAARHFFDYAFRLFEHRLLNEKVPGKVKLGGVEFRHASFELETSKWNIPANCSAEWRTEGRGIWSTDHPLYTVWVDFERNCKAAGLEPQWAYTYNGDDSWYELTVTAAN